MTHFRQKALHNALRNRCPYCGTAPLYQRFLKLLPECRNCGSSFQTFDSADAPAFFVSALLCAVAGTTSLIIEMRGGAAFWIHTIIWLFIIVVLTALLLRPTKSILIGLQVRYDAHEVDIVKPSKDD